MNYVSCKHIVSRVFRNLKPSDDNWVLDAVEWIGEGLRLIGRGVNMQTSTVIIDVEDFKAALPSGLLRIEQIGWLEEGSTVPTPIYKTTATLLAENIGESSSQVVKVKQNGSYLHFSKESGQAMISYISLALDEDGWPMVADHPSFSNGLFFYIVRNMMDGGFKHPHLTYLEVDDMWLRYCAQARTQAIAPDLMDMERLRLQWVNLLPVERYTSFFNEEMRTNEGSYARIEPSEPVNPLDFNL
jgi:hypothetical protein